MTRPRSEIDDRYLWDPTAVYETPDDFDRELETARELVRRVRDALDAPPDDAERVSTTLERFERLGAARTRLVLYAEMGRTMDLTDDDARERRDRVRALEGDVEAVATSLRRWVREHDRRFETLRAESGAHSPFDRLLENAAGAPAADPALTDLLADFGDVLDATDRILVAICDEDFEPPTVEGPDGDPVEVAWYGRSRLLKHPDRAYRRRVYETFHDALAERRGAIATAWIEKLRSRARLAEARGYDSIRELSLGKPSYPETGIHLELPTAVHDALCEHVSASLDPYHRLQRIRRDRLGLDELRPWDRLVPLADAPAPEIAYEDAWDHLLAAVEPLGADYRDRLATLRAERRVDAFPAENAREVTYCLSASDRGAFVSASYDGTVRTAFHLAHELGHAMETELRGDVRRPLYETTPRPAEEVPSVVHELLLADHLLDGGDDALRAHVRDRLLTMLGGNLFGAARSARFVRTACRAVEAGESLSADRLDAINEDLLAAFQPHVAGEERWAASWLARAHVRDPYHHYQYALGAVGAVAATDALADGALPVDDYRSFLEFGGTEPSLAQFEHLGIDPTSPAPYRRAADRFDAVLEEIESD
ncbi:M3 family oligoendopeptidase [Halovivax sp.]|uniref:M3 family oligoendopeptidase n=1 Tax=Halovivax sp. TaxID=1935978 RepID=UPI0025B8F354|nr:M3 family metallopeptidase [Halovivax sp.]